MTRKRDWNWRPFDLTRDELLRRVGGDEKLIAHGRVHDVNLFFGAGHQTLDYLAVTDRRVLVAVGALGTDRSMDYELGLDAVRAWSEQTIGHRWFIDLRHEPETRPRHRPKNNILWMHWGNTRSSIAETDAALWFSRRDTAAARALREQLDSRDVPTVSWTLSVSQEVMRPRRVRLALMRNRHCRSVARIAPRSSGTRTAGRRP